MEVTSVVLGEILAELEYQVLQGDERVNIYNIANNSQKTKTGDLFVCIPGHRHDGHKFISEAVFHGAVAVLVESETNFPADVTVVKVPNTRAIQGELISRLLGNPSSKLNIVGVTGTNGKTTITYLIETILKAVGRKTGLIGTVENRLYNLSIPAFNTTPDPICLQQMLHQMVQLGITDAVMEVSSHGIAQHRVRGCEFDAAILSNITHDHLDYHQDLLKYRETKVDFFRQVMRKQNKILQAGIINLDDPSSVYLTEIVSSKLLTYGIRNPKAMIQADKINLCAGGMFFNVITPEEKQPFFLPMKGLHNVYNLLAAVSYGYINGIALTDMARTIARFKGVPGRLEQVKAGQEFEVIVDYAHNPDGLKQALLTLRQQAVGKIITVFGCEGNRDKLKRPLMGRIAVNLSDFVIVTSDNLHYESAENIINDILFGLQGYEKKYSIIPDRTEAIRIALTMAQKDDIVLIAGKGHEKVQVVGNNSLPFNDREEVLKILADDSFHQQPADNFLMVNP